MITLNASGGSVTFTFSGNSTYLNDGVITCPINSLALIIDESDMISFKKANSNDLFVSANIAEFGMTKAELETWFKENAVGGDITSGEVQTMIDEAVSGKTDISAFTAHTSDTTVHVTTAQTTAWDNKANVWCGDETAWGQISGGTLDSNTLYLVY